MNSGSCVVSLGGREPCFVGVMFRFSGSLELTSDSMSSKSFAQEL